MQYLQDARLPAVTKAIGIISKMMYEHTTTGVTNICLQRPEAWTRLVNNLIDLQNPVHGRPRFYFICWPLLSVHIAFDRALEGGGVLRRNGEGVSPHVATLREILFLSVRGVLPLMMFVSVLSVVQEVIEFFVMVFPIGAPRPCLGCALVFSLIWSKEPGVRMHCA